MNSISSSSQTQDCSGQAVALLENWPGEQLLQANLAALSQFDPKTADLLAAAKVPANTRLAVTRDGSVSYRFIAADGRSSWLGKTSVPAIASKANCERTDLQRGNLAMNTFGQGADARAFLDKMGPQQALIVTDSDASVVNLAMRLYDFQPELYSGRLILILDDESIAALVKFYQAHPGYHIVEQVITNFTLSEAENQVYAQRITTAMEQVAGMALAAVNDTLADYRKTATHSKTDLAELLQAGNLSGLSIINFAAGFSTNRNAAARDALAGLSQLGAHTDLSLFDRPDKVSLYAQAKRLAQHKPHVILLVDMFRRDLPITVSQDVAVLTLMFSVPSSFAVEADSMGPNDMAFAVNTEHLIRLRKGGIPTDQSAKLPCFADEQLYKPLETPPADEFVCDVAIVADRPSSDPEKYNIQLDSHQALWQAVLQEIARQPQAYNASTAKKFLRRAQSCGVQLKEKDLQDYFESLIANHLGHAALCDIYSKTLADAGFDLGIWSRTFVKSPEHDTPAFWFESPCAGYVRGYADSPDKQRQIASAAKVCVYLGDDAFAESQLLNCIAAGGFCLVRSPATENRSDGILQMFEQDKELITFDSPQDLQRKVKHYLNNEPHRLEVAAAARAKLLEKHTAKVRMVEMLQKLRIHLQR